MLHSKGYALYPGWTPVSKVNLGSSHSSSLTNGPFATKKTIVVIVIFSITMTLCMSRFRPGAEDNQALFACEAHHPALQVENQQQYPETKTIVTAAAKSTNSPLGSLPSWETRDHWLYPGGDHQVAHPDDNDDHYDKTSGWEPQWRWSARLTVAIPLPRSRSTYSFVTDLRIHHPHNSHNHQHDQHEWKAGGVVQEQPENRPLLHDDGGALGKHLHVPRTGFSFAHLVYIQGCWLSSRKWLSIQSILSNVII